MQGWQGLSDARVQLSLLLSFPHRGNGWSKPLDSSAFVPDTALPPASMQAGLRRAATGILPSRRIPDFLSINDGGVASGFCRNDGEGCGQAFVRHGQGAVGMATNSFRPRRHSSAGWNPGEGAGECRDGRVYRMPVSSCRYYCHSRTAGMDGLNHWIPRPSFQTRLYHLHAGGPEPE